MADATNLQGSSNNAKMREAMKLLGEQFGIKDKNSFVQILLMGAAAPGTGELSSDGLSETSRNTNASLQAVADAIISLQGEGKYIDEVVEVFETYIAGGANDPNDDVALTLLSEPPSTGSGQRHGNIFNIFLNLKIIVFF